MGLRVPSLPQIRWAFFIMKFLENDLEEIIYTSGRDVLEKRGLFIVGKLFKQVKIGNYGIADLIEFERPYYDGDTTKYLVPGRITIYELKKDQIGIAAFLQSIRYAKGVLEYLRHRKLNRHYIIDIRLVGKTVDDKGAFCYIENMLGVNNDFYDSNGIIENGTITFYTYKYAADGINFLQMGNYDLLNKGFEL